MYYSRIYLHLLWTTENCQNSLNNYSKKLGSFLMSHAEKKGIDCLMISVLANHVHCLIKINSTQSVSDIVQILKGSSSLWINKNSFLPYKFKWEDEYFAFSISYSQLSEFKNYLMNQSKFHETVGVKKEIQNISNVYKLNYKL